MNKLTRYVLIIFAFSWMPIAHATLTSGTVSNLSGTRNIPYNQPSSITIRWSMVRTSTVGDPGVTVSSQSGQFTDSTGTIVLGSVFKVLSQSRPVGAVNNVFTFTETVRVPRDVLFKAFKQNIPTIFYRREFTDCPGVECLVLRPALAVSFSVTGSAAGAFAISRYSLRFEDGATGAVIPQNQPLRAEALLEVNGSGTLKGIWEVATSGSTAGTPFYQHLRMVTRQASSGQTIRLLSPVLPATQVGTHLVRFRLLEPELSQETPVLQYVVLQKPQAFPKIETIAPENGASIDHRSLFQWQAVNNTYSYNLELVASKPMDGPHVVKPVTGILFKGSENQGSLTPSLMQNLKPGLPYWWRVLALDKNGKAIAASDWNWIQVAK